MLCILTFACAHAQSEIREVNNAAGKSGNGYYTISFGEPVVGYSTGASTGFLAPNDTLIITTTASTPVANATVQIFPNPVTTTLRIQSQQVLSKITLYDFSGKTLFTQNTSSQQSTIDMSVYANGTYLLEIVYNQSTKPTVARIIKNQ